MAANPVTRLTPEQYLSIERTAEIKSEYHDGQMFAMSGGSAAHAFIPARIIAAVLPGLRSGGCDIATSDLRVRVTPTGPFFYPDLTICCGEPRLADEYRDVLLNPSVIFEVISRSSEAYDRGFKFAQYRLIESLREYVLVSQTEPRIEVFTRQPDHSWVLHESVGMDAICRLTSVGVEFSLNDIYRNIRLDA
ncbi:MAG TPA: Uma2 family endonuclease [Bryobacteraceae bacterium]|nr:Uma2 family endonuclease [Bryobacteraceae bacterium]